MAAHLRPPPRLKVQQPGITPDAEMLVQSSSDQESRVIPTIAQTHGSMATSLYRPRFTHTMLKLTPVQ